MGLDEGLYETWRNYATGDRVTELEREVRQLKDSLDNERAYSRELENIIASLETEKYS